VSKAKNRQLFGFTADRMVLQVWTVTGSATIGGDVDVSGNTNIQRKLRSRQDWLHTASAPRKVRQ
jgi:hypothetical protein